MSSLSAAASPMLLLVPMPIPRTPNAPYFDERGVRTFLRLILQHGSNVGIQNADELVTFIVRYSSDRVREVIQYIPELDDDEPNRTWAATQQQILLLYGSYDEERRSTERELIDFCREQSAKSPFHSKVEIEQYLRAFQYIAAPLLKQREITVAQGDFYFNWKDGDERKGCRKNVSKTIESKEQIMAKSQEECQLKNVVNIWHRYKTSQRTQVVAVWSEQDTLTKDRSQRGV
ncbi:hypothetical protein B0H16DRAFT_1756736 [Mycena metata]|uniref:Uncharacterized protein n=1 Tax=Mycena metata TaxID=1033252 RepID=A0AAD7NU94_9AGAR|nr:hypothetical protein B0H16DRAFT_1756736 [Mycena metata]